MNLKWFPADLPKEGKANHEASIKASTTLIHQFLNILDGLEEELNRQETNPDKMSVDWFAKQVFVNGQRKAIRDIRTLFNFADKA